MRSLFQLASGSVVGRDHIHDGRNNQDAYYVLEESALLVLVVCDGCGEAKHSEVGSQLGSRLIAHTIARLSRKSLAASEDVSSQLAGQEFWERVRQDVLAQLRVISLQIGESLSEVVGSHFLFTTVGALITGGISVFFSLGDGVLFVNEERYKLGPYPNNEPPYLGYGLVATTREYEPAALRFRIPLALPTDQLNSFLIGTDGVDELIQAEARTLPGKEEVVGGIDQLWRGDRLFNNKSALPRRLNLLNAEARIPDWDRRIVNRQPGLLHDDTTLIVGRKKEEV